VETAIKFDDNSSEQCTLLEIVTQRQKEDCCICWLRQWRASIATLRLLGRHRRNKALMFLYNKKDQKISEVDRQRFWTHCKRHHLGSGHNQDALINKNKLGGADGYESPAVWKQRSFACSRPSKY